MSNRRYPSPYWRYLRARLLNLGKPSFWGTAIFLCVVGLVVQQYWSNPQVTNNPNTANTTAEDSDLTQEDKAIAADIDNLPSLFADTEPIITPATTKSQKDKNKTPSITANTKSPSVDSPKPNSDLGLGNQSPTPIDKNIFVSEAENLLRFGATDNNQLMGYKPVNGISPTTGGTANTSILIPGLVNQVNTSQNVNSNNLLPTGLTQSTNQTPSVNNNPSSIINSTVPTYGGVTQALPTSTQPSQGFSPSTGLNSGLGYTQPSYTNNLNNVQPLPINTRVNSSTGYTQPNYYNNLNNNQPIAPNTGFNSGVGYSQPAIPNPPNSLNYPQNLPNQTQSTSTITGTSPIIGPYTVRSPRTNAGFNGGYGNSILAQPTQTPQPIYSNNNSYQGQPVNGYPNNPNNYSYP